MIRPLILAVLFFSASVPQVFGQQYYLSSGDYRTPAPVEWQSSAPPISENAAGPYAFPGTPYAQQYPTQQYPTQQYPAPCPVYYPAAGEESFSTVPGVPYPATYTSATALSSGSPYAVPSTTPYAMPDQAVRELPYGASSGVYSPAPYALPYASTYPATQVTGQEGPDPPPLPTAADPQGDPPASPTPEPAATEKATPEESGDEEGEKPLHVEEETPGPWYYAPVQWLDPWEGNVEIGLSGSEGNTQTLNYLLGLDAKRETDDDIINFDVTYDRKSAESVETAPRLFGEIRWELLFEDSLWTWYFHETTEYDEFKAFDVRLSYDTGLGRRLIKNEITSLLARAGAGTSHEIGGPNENLVPEAVFGLEFSHKLNERQKLSASSEYSPDVTDFRDYRLKSKASWEVVLDEETNLSLKVSILDRYDSTPDGKKPNDLDYTFTLLWSF